MDKKLEFARRRFAKVKEDRGHIDATVSHTIILLLEDLINKAQAGDTGALEELEKVSNYFKGSVKRTDPDDYEAAVY